MYEWFMKDPNTAMVTIIIAVSVIIAAIYFIYKNKKSVLAKAALYAVSKAEEAWGSKTGRIKFAEAYTYLTKQYPIVTFFFTEAQLTNIIETALAEMKKILTTKQGLESKEASSQDT